MQNAAANVDEYIASFPLAIQEKLVSMRRTIKEAAPNAEELISYAIPGYKQRGLLVHFAAFKHHLGFYPGAEAMAYFAAELSAYKTSKGAVQFPLDGELPLELVARITEHRVAQDLEKKKK